MIKADITGPAKHVTIGKTFYDETNGYVGFVLGPNFKVKSNFSHIKLSVSAFVDQIGVLNFIITPIGNYIYVKGKKLLPCQSSRSSKTNVGTAPISAEPVDLLL